MSNQLLDGLVTTNVCFRIYASSVVEIKKYILILIFPLFKTVHHFFKIFDCYRKCYVFLVFVELDTQTCLQTLQIGRHRAYNCRRGGWMPEGRLEAQEGRLEA